MSTTTRPPKRGDAARRQARRQRLMLILAGVAVLVLAVVIAVLSAGEGGTAVTVEDVAGTPAILGEDLPPPPADPTADPQIGTAAPVVNGTDRDGGPITIGGSGTPQLLMFVASWCPACQQELPEVVAWLDAGGLPDGVELTTVVTGLDASRPNWPPGDWLDEEGYDGRVLMDDAEGSVARGFGLPATPYWVALDGQGQVVHRSAGMLPQEQLDQLAQLVAPA
jgi:cytochrome c biogenesis protein CcmG, thiol:disulfide interchange protein DsbE